MTWQEILQLAASAGIISGLITTLLTVGIKAIETYQSRQRNAAYLGLRLSVILDTYFHQCLNCINDIDDNIASNGHAGSCHFGVPLPPAFPTDDTGWLSLESEIASQILSLLPRIKYMNKALQYDWYANGIPQEEADMNDVLSNLYEIADDVYMFSRRIRTKYHFKQLKHSEKSYEYFVQAKQKHFSRKPPESNLSLTLSPPHNTK